jgi:hypothetical protein
VSLSTPPHRARKRVKREIIRQLPAWDAVACRPAVLEPGMLLSAWQIRRDPSSSPETPYLVEFRSNDRTFQCALYVFLPRTRAMETSETAAEGSAA